MAESTERVQKLAADVLNVARNTLIVNLRFMDQAISMLEPVSLKEEERIAVDGQTIFYNPIFVLKSFMQDRNLPARQYLHMVFHCIYQHFWISSMVNRPYWDLACDIAVEYSIMGLEVSALETVDSRAQKEAIDQLRTKVKYMTADWLYRYFCDTSLSEDELERMNALFRRDGHWMWYTTHSMQENESSQESSEDSGVSQRIDDDQDEMKDVETDQEMSEDGSREDEQIWFDQNISNKKTERPRISSQEKRMLDEDTVQEWKEIANQMKMDLETFSKQRGEHAGGLIQNLMAVTRERYDYASFLRKFAVMGERMRINDEEFDYVFYTYGLKMYEKMPLIEPLEYKDVKQVRELVVAIDTSGSTSGKLVQAFIQKTYSILMDEESFFTRFNIHIVQCDAEIQEAVKITNREEFERYLSTMKIRGMGGTDFRPVFRYVDKLIEDGEFVNLKGMIYFTDGFGLFPHRQPNYNVAVVYVNEGYENPEVPVWAIKLMLEPEDIERLG